MVFKIECKKYDITSIIIEGDINLGLSNYITREHAYFHNTTINTHLAYTFLSSKVAMNAFFIIHKAVKEYYANKNNPLV